MQRLFSGLGVAVAGLLHVAQWHCVTSYLTSQPTRVELSDSEDGFDEVSLVQVSPHGKDDDVKRKVRPLDALAFGGGHSAFTAHHRHHTHHVVKEVQADVVPGGARISITTAKINMSHLIQGIKMPMPAVTGSLVPSLYAGVTTRNFSSIYFAGENYTGSEGSNGSRWVYMNGSMVPSFGARQPVDLIPVWEVKQAISDAVEEGIRKAEEAAAENNTRATMEDIKRAVNAEVYSSFHSLQNTMKSNRFRRKAWNTTPGGFVNFFKSVGLVDWFLFSIFIVVFLLQHHYVLNWPSTKTFHGAALLIWIVMAGLYNFVVFQRFGATGGILWLNGYILELVFLIENVLVCHIILQAFRTPKWVNEKALFLVVICRVIYQMIFYMGLAELVFSGQALPYILGLWLLFVAFQSAMDDEDAGFDIMDTRVVHLARAVFGERLSLTKDDQGALFVVKESKMRLSLAGLMVFCLIVVDFLLHVDVALTKIEELQGNAFLCFTSAAAASFCMPEFIFVTRDILRRFPGLKYGISVVLVYIALQMLLHQVWWPPISMDLIIWVGILVVSAAVPVSAKGWRSGNSRAVDTGTQACFVQSDKSSSGAQDVGVQ